MAASCTSGIPRHLVALLLGLVLGAVHLPAQALHVSLSLDGAAVTAGQGVSIDALVSDRAAGAGGALAAFDLSVSYDPALLMPTGVLFGTLLGDPATQAFTDAVFATPGLVSFAEVSLLTGAELNQLQPAAFAMAQLSFVAVASGTASFAYAGEIRIDNADGVKLIHEPATAALLLLGLAAAAQATRVRYTR
jgi:hypothetical protein